MRLLKLRIPDWPKLFTCFAQFLFAINAVAAPIISSPSTPGKQAYLDFAMQHSGDVGRGKQIFNNEKKLACVTCHTTDGTAKKAGPDLASIGDKFSRRELIQSILEPSSTIAIGYGGTILETTSGESYEGIIKQATESWIELMKGDGKSIRLATGDIQEQHASKLSLMPEGMESTLMLPEFSDLVDYLASLHQAVKTGVPSSAMLEVIPQAMRSVELTPFFDSNVKLDHPVWFGEVPGFTNLFVVLEMAGKSWVIQRISTGDKQTSLLDLSGQVRTGGGSGLLGMAFHPKFPHNRKYYLKYQIEKNGHISTLLVERKFTKDFKNDSGESLQIMEIPAVTQDHTGGGIGFGPDGFLYLGMGDTGPQGDPQGHAQDLNLLLGKILRIDVDHTEKGYAYRIPKDNPFRKKPGVRPEIWAYGFREPWRFSFDAKTGDFWIGDVGQNLFEEITVARIGENHGWNIFEGVTPFSERYRRAGEKYVPPVFSYPHGQGVSVTGGYVYRGRRAPALQGHYICGDFGSRRLWALTQTNRTLTSLVEIGRAPAQVVSFTEDSEGELYIVGYDTGIIYQMNLTAVDPTPIASQSIAATSEQSPILWRYTSQPPDTNWFINGFDDSKWAFSPGGFGTQGTPGAVIRTEWRTRDIWLRRTFTVPENILSKKGGAFALQIHHDEDAEIYLNGIEIARLPRWTTGYIEIPLSPQAAGALHVGNNILAIHCRQNSGGQYIDAGLIQYLKRD